MPDGPIVQAAALHSIAMLVVPVSLVNQALEMPPQMGGAPVTMQRVLVGQRNCDKLLPIEVVEVQGQAVILPEAD